MAYKKPGKKVKYEKLQDRVTHRSRNFADALLMEAYLRHQYLPDESNNLSDTVTNLQNARLNWGELLLLKSLCQLRGPHIIEEAPSTGKEFHIISVNDTTNLKKNR